MSRRGENQFSFSPYFGRPPAENAPLSSDVLHLRNVTQNGKMVSRETHSGEEEDQGEGEGGGANDLYRRAKTQTLQRLSLI